MSVCLSQPVTCCHHLFAEQPLFFQTNQTLSGILFFLPEVVQLHQHVACDFILMGCWFIKLYNRFPLHSNSLYIDPYFYFLCVCIASFNSSVNNIP